MPLSRCTTCNGRKKTLQLGGLYKDCKACKGIGFVEQELSTHCIVIDEPMKSTIDTYIDTTQAKRVIEQSLPQLTGIDKPSQKPGQRKLNLTKRNGKQPKINPAKKPNTLLDLTKP